MENNNILLGESQNEAQPSNNKDLHTENPEIEKENSSIQILHEEGSDLENENISLQNSTEDSTIEGGHEDIESSREMHVHATHVETETEEIHNEAEESTKRQIETPILLIIGIAYLFMAIMPIIFRPSSSIPFILIIIGSGFLIGLYIISRTIGFPQIGIEHVGPLDLVTNLFQGGIIACSLYLLKAKRRLNNVKILKDLHQIMNLLASSDRLYLNIQT